MRNKFIRAMGGVLDVKPISQSRHSLFEVRGALLTQMAAQDHLKDKGATSRVIDNGKEHVLVVPTHSECNKDIDIPEALSEVAEVSYRQ